MSEHFRQAVILAAFVDKVRRTGLACGETLVQKAAFVMKELLGVPLIDEFRIHYYGPFSFQLRSRLEAMEADEFVRVTPREMGVTYDIGERYTQLRDRFQKTLAEYDDAISFAAERMGNLGVKRLEPLTTALYVTRQQPTATASEREAKLRAIKQHVTPAEARDAISTIDQWIAEVGRG